jgi:hypothetical protein
MRAVRLFALLTPKIANLAIRCPFADEGCEWVGTLGADDRVIDEHLQKACKFAQFETCQQCKAWVQRGERATHDKTLCPLRQVACPHCAETMQARVLPAHKLLGGDLRVDWCENRVRCPFPTCKATMPRADLARHAVESCEARRVVCSGCPVPHLLPLHQLPAHLATLDAAALQRQTAQQARQLFAPTTSFFVVGDLVRGNTRGGKHSLVARFPLPPHNHLPRHTLRYHHLVGSLGEKEEQTS